MLADDHKDKVDNPEYKAETDKTYNARDDFAVRETRDRAADPRSKRDYSEYQTDDIGKTEVITLCHDFHLLYYCMYNIMFIWLNQVVCAIFCKIIR